MVQAYNGEPPKSFTLRTDFYKGVGDKLMKETLVLSKLDGSSIMAMDVKLLNAYLSRIDSENPNVREVVFSKEELCDILGAPNLRTYEIFDYAASLLDLRVIWKRADGSFSIYSIFENVRRAYGEWGRVSLSLTCAPHIMKDVFCAEGTENLLHKLQNAAKLSSGYACALYLYLEQHKEQQEWLVDLDLLREILGCDDVESYKQFKLFSDRVLKRSHKEIEEKIGLRFSYAPVRIGRTVVAVRFAILESVPCFNYSNRFYRDQITELTGVEFADVGYSEDNRAYFFCCGKEDLEVLAGEAEEISAMVEECEGREIALGLNPSGDKVVLAIFMV